MNVDANLHIAENHYTMTIDERLDRLTERHEALTGHVELLTADITELTKRVNALTANGEHQGRIMDDLLTGLKTLVELSASHERRIERLEGI